MREAPHYVWWNGELVRWEEARVHITILGWSTLGAVFEGIKAYWNADHRELYGLQFGEHYRRFLYSMRFQRMEPRWSVDELNAASAELLRTNQIQEDSYVRPMAYFGDTTWFSTGAESGTHCFIWTTPFRSVLGAGATVRACVSSWTRLGDNMMPPRIKCVSNYQNSRMALIEARRHGYEYPILLNDRGKVTEGPASCLFIVRDGVAITPAITSGILESITRGTILKACREELAIPTEEREVDRSELYVADEIFFCGTGAEIQAVSEVDGYKVASGGIGPVTARIERSFHDLVRGRSLHAHYRTPIYRSIHVAT
ncbi:MAG: branched-chain-amino-acid transaminase [Gammaproteobacteria bacterium]